VLLVASLQPVVELLDEPFLDLRHHLVGVEPAETLLQQGMPSRFGVAQIRGHGFAHPRVLHLHRDRALLAGDRGR
jgi:hypothetical protein